METVVGESSESVFEIHSRISTSGDDARAVGRSQNRGRRTHRLASVPDLIGARRDAEWKPLDRFVPLRKEVVQSRTSPDEEKGTGVGYGRKIGVSFWNGSREQSASCECYKTIPVARMVFRAAFAGTAVALRMRTPYPDGDGGDGSGDAAHVGDEVDGPVPRVAQHDGHSY